MDCSLESKRTRDRSFSRTVEPSIRRILKPMPAAAKERQLLTFGASFGLTVAFQRFRTHRKPIFEAELSGVFDVLAATR